MKKTFATILALVLATPAMAGWTDNVYWYNNDKDENEDTSVTTASKSGVVELKNGSTAGADRTIGTFTVTNNVTQVKLVQHSGRTTNLTIDSFVSETDFTLTVATNTSLTLKKLTSDSLTNIVVDGSMTLGAGAWTDEANRQALSGVSITVNGTLTLKSCITGLDTFTLDADSVIEGTYNVGSNGVDKLSITLSDASVVASALSEAGFYEKQLAGSMWNAEKIRSAELTIDGYASGGLIFQNEDGKYYSKAEWVNNGQSVTYSGEITELTAETAYTVAKVEGTSITGLYAHVFASVPEPGTATLSLLALAGLAARRRRK